MVCKAGRRDSGGTDPAFYELLDDHHTQTQSLAPVHSPLGRDGKTLLTVTTTPSLFTAATYHRGMATSGQGILELHDHN